MFTSWCAGSGPSTSMLCTWFRHWVSIAIQRLLAHVIRAWFLRLEECWAGLDRDDLLGVQGGLIRAIRDFRQIEDSRENGGLKSAVNG